MSAKGGGEVARTAQILFVKSSKNGIPNKDPETGDARRLFQDGRISVSDVSVKRDARDFVAARHPEGGGTNHVYFRAVRTEGGTLLGRQEMAHRILEHEGVDPSSADLRLELPRRAWDVRTFGVVYSVGGENFSETGPVQLSWGHSMHPVESEFVRNTVSLPARGSTEARPLLRPPGLRRAAEANGETEGGGGTGATALREEEVQRGARQGTVAESFVVPFAVYLVPGVVNHTLSKALGTTRADVDLLLEGLWSGTRVRQARGRGFQQPLFLLHVEYEDPFLSLGPLEEDLSLVPPREAWFAPDAPSSVGEVSLDVARLAATLQENEGRIARARVLKEPRLRLEGELPPFVGQLGPF